METGIYGYQQGWTIDYGSYNSKGIAAGSDVGANLGVGSYTVDPSVISGRGHGTGLSVISIGGQKITDDDGNWIGSRASIGAGLGLSTGQEHEKSHDKACWKANRHHQAGRE
jgi:hypothetical protein